MRWNHFALLSVYCAVVQSTESPIVDVGYAKYQGTLDPVSNNTHFFGIRYGAAPVGESFVVQVLSYPH